MPFVPEWSGALTANYHWNLTDSVEANVGGVLNYIGDRKDDYSGRAPLTVPSYTVLDLHAGVDFKNYEITLFAKNVGDSRGITALSTESLAPGFNPYGASIIQPRTIGLQLTARFQ